LGMLPVGWRWRWLEGAKKVTATLELFDEPPASAIRAVSLGTDLSNEIGGLTMLSGLRTRLAAACHFTAMEHHCGISLLFSAGHPAPALALLRPVFESYIRGVWLSDCATDSEIKEYTAGNWKRMPPIKALVERLEAIPTFDTGILSQSLSANWETMCGYTHTGIEQVGISSSNNAIERTCTSEQIDEALDFAGACAIMAAIAIAAMAENASVANKLMGVAMAFATRET
jgi:hypothetical protein